MPLRHKKFILALQPHEVSPNRTERSPLASHKTIAFCAGLVLLMGLAFSNALDDHLAAVKKGLTRIATYEQLCPYMPSVDARMLLNSWYGITVSCTEPTETMWQSYCQQFYISEGGDCGAVSAQMKAEVMNNMRICRVSGG